MKLVCFTHSGNTAIGKLVDDFVIDLSGVEGVGSSMSALLADLPALRPALESTDGPAIPVAEVKLEAPVNDASKFLAIGLNYRKHAEEAKAAGIPIPSDQFWFNKQVSCVNGPYDAVVKPSVSDKMDYEVELGVVIGKRCRNVSRQDARSVIAGYLITNDISARDWQNPSFTLGKSFDTCGPIGPWLTTDDEIADPHDLQMRLWINGEERQNSNTCDMIYDIYDQIEHLTKVMTLEPGDILATGTPEGVGAAMNMFLQPGDVIRIEIEGLGHIENAVIAEADQVQAAE